MGAETPDTMLWNLWAAKEAAYKVVSKSHPVANSIPHRYEAHLESTDFLEAAGRVISPYGSIEIETSFTDHYIHCIGISRGKTKWDSVVSKVEKVAEGLSLHNESEAIRDLLRRDLSRHLSIYPDHIEILRTKGPLGLGPPQVYIKGEKSTIDISMSHDGQFMAYAYVRG